MNSVFMDSYIKHHVFFLNMLHKIQPINNIMTLTNQTFRLWWRFRSEQKGESQVSMKHWNDFFNEMVKSHVQTIFTFVDIFYTNIL